MRAAFYCREAEVGGRTEGTVLCNERPIFPPTAETKRLFPSATARTLQIFLWRATRGVSFQWRWMHSHHLPRPAQWQWVMSLAPVVDNSLSGEHSRSQSAEPPNRSSCRLPPGPAITHRLPLLE
jgi:hypothetical protein